MNSKPITVLGMYFESQKAALDYFGITKPTVNARLKNGMSIDDAYSTPQRRSGIAKQTTVAGKTFPSLRAACKHYGRSEDTVKARIAAGYSPEDALTRSEKYFQDRRQKGFELQVGGNIYRSESEACKALGIDPSKVNHYKIRHGTDFTTALSHYIKLE